GGSDNMIGCTVPEEANVISGNNDDAILITDTNATHNMIQGNFIGTAADGVAGLPNDGAGVAIYDGTNNIIGFDLGGNGRANIIAFNTGAGVEIQSGTESRINNIISRNSIHDNLKLGLDLVGVPED